MLGGRRTYWLCFLYWRQLVAAALYGLPAGSEVLGLVLKLLPFLVIVLAFGVAGSGILRC